MGDVLLVAIAGLIVLWILTPPLMHVLRVTKLQYESWPEPFRAEPSAADPAYTTRFEQFAQLGFRPVGTSREAKWFFSPLHWRWSSVEPQRWLAHPNGHTFASFHRLLPGEPIRFGIVTFLSNGGRVRTTCPGTGYPSPVIEGSLLTALTRVDPSELWTEHQRFVDDFCAARDLTGRNVTFAEALEAEAIVDRQILRALKQRNTYALLLLSFPAPALIAFGAIGYLVTHRFDWRTAALGICAGGVAFAWMRHVVFPAALADAKRRSHDARPRRG